MRQSFIALTTALFLTACAGSGDKFPYPPQFVSPRDIPVETLNAPPVKGSPEFAREVDKVLSAQKHLSAQEKKVLMAEDHIRPEMIVQPVLGAPYTAEKYPALYTLLKHTASDSWRICDAVQDYWQSPRPFVADSRVKLYVKSLDRPGYPSGHTITNGVWAYTLSELFPEKRSALFTRAWMIGYHRVEAGVHFPHHVEAGKIMAAAIYEKMKLNPEFQHELQAAREEVQSGGKLTISDAISNCNASVCARPPLGATIH